MVKIFSLSNLEKVKKKHKLLLPTLLTFGVTMASSSALVYAAPGTEDVLNTPLAQQEFRANQAGAQLAQMGKWQMQQTENALLKQGSKSNTSIQNNNQKTGNQAGTTVKFILKDVVFSDSKVLKPKDFESLIAPYKGKEVDLQNLYAIVSALNKQYQDQGYLTCEAYLPPQRIKNGIVHINLSEGVNGNVTVKGNKHTRTSYITQRIDLQKGKIPKLSDMNAAVLRFNATNDAQLHITLEPGKEKGTTDYILTLTEPQRSTVGIVADNAGNETSGKFRKGIYWNYRSLTGVRDTFGLTAVTTQGNKNYAMSYSRPISKKGLTLNVNANLNRVRMTKGPLSKLNMRGKGNSYSLGLTQPIKTTATVKSDMGISFMKQHSQNDITGNTKWTDDTTKSLDVFYDHIHYGKSHTIYQKYDYELGASRAYKGVSEQGNIYKTKHFSKLSGYALYQKRFKQGNLLNLTFSWQLSPTHYLPSEEQFFLGGSSTVRGYSNNVISGDGGAYGRAEYNVPIDKKKATYVYTFLDGGQVWGKSAFDSRRLAALGFGIRSNISNHNSLNIGIGFPIIKTLNGVPQPKHNVSINYNGYF